MYTTSAMISLIVLFGFCLAGVWGSDLEALRVATIHTNYGIVRLGPDNYTKYTLAKDADYSIIVFFTASDPRYNCVPCALATKEFVLASKSYATAHKVRFLGPSADGTPPTNPFPHDDRTVFFAVVDVKFNMEAFTVHGFSTAPHIVGFFKGKHLKNPYKATDILTPQSPKVEIPQEHFVTQASEPISAQSILSVIPGEVISVSVPVADRAPLAALSSLLFALFGSLLSSHPSHAGFYRQPWFWALVCMGIYFISISGVIGSIIRTPPWYGVTQVNKVVLFSEGSEQYIFEGIVVGTLNLAAAGSVIGLILLAKTRKVATLLKFTLAIICISVFVAAFTHLVQEYQAKTTWYQLDHLIPSEWRNPLVKKYTSWLRWYRKRIQPQIDTYVNVSMEAITSAWTASSTHVDSAHAEL